MRTPGPPPSERLRVHAGNVPAADKGWALGFFLCTNQALVLLTQAYKYLEEMRRQLPSASIAYYVNQRTVGAVHQGLGIPLPRVGPEEHASRSSAEDRTEADEEVPDEADAEP